MDILELAKTAIRQYLDTGETMSVPDGLSPSLERKVACFVTLHERDGSLRGCIGTIEPVRGSLAEEVIENAISSAVYDPRFLPVTREEFDALDVSVDVLELPVLTKDLSILDPQIYGVIVATDDGRRGVLLPHLEGVDSVAEQIGICRQKGGIGLHEKVDIYRFTVVRYASR